MQRPRELRQGVVRTLAMMLVGVLFYTGTSLVTSFAAAGNGNIRPGVAIPIFFGFAFGPLTGFVVGFAGNLLHDLLQFGYTPSAGSTLLEVSDALQLNWQLGNGLMGLVAGLVTLWGWCYRTVREQVRAMVVAIGAVVIGIGVACLLDPLVSPADYAHINVWDRALRVNFIPISLVNIANVLLVIPMLLYNLDRERLPLNSLRRSGLMRQVLLTIVLSTVVPIAMLSMFLTVSSDGEAAIWQLVLTILLAALFIVTNAAMMTQNMTRPLLQLSAAAEAMEQGQLSLEQAAAMREVPGDDEIAQLNRVFSKMAQEVIQREQTLRQHVQELQIIIDERKRSDQVNEIVETDFFRDLRQKARAMRDRKDVPLSKADEQPA